MVNVHIVPLKATVWQYDIYQANVDCTVTHLRCYPLEVCRKYASTRDSAPSVGRASFPCLEAR